MICVAQTTFVSPSLLEVALKTTIVIPAPFVKIVFASSKTAINAQPLLSAHPISAAAVFASAILAKLVLAMHNAQVETVRARFVSRALVNLARPSLLIARQITLVRTQLV